LDLARVVGVSDRKELLGQLHQLLERNRVLRKEQTRLTEEYERLRRRADELNKQLWVTYQRHQHLSKVLKKPSTQI
jgi:hypothetical protein